MVDEPVALRRKYRAENGLVAVSHSGSQGKIPPSKINRIFHLIDATRKEERSKVIALASVSWDRIGDVQKCELFAQEFLFRRKTA